MELFRARRRYLFLGLLAALGLLLIPVGSASAGPPGDNGTVKIDGVVFDDAPDNEPHVGCIFQVDFYGYEQGNFNATVTFTVWPPTAKKDVLLSGYPKTVFIGGDPAGGGTDLDGSTTNDLSSVLKPYMAQPNQGYHIKLTVNAPHSIGADTKYKTFWVQQCGYAG